MCIESLPARRAHLFSCLFTTCFTLLLASPASAEQPPWRDYDMWQEDMGRDSDGYIEPDDFPDEVDEGFVDADEDPYWDKPIYEQDMPSDFSHEDEWSHWGPCEGPGYSCVYPDEPYEYDMNASDNRDQGGANGGWTLEEAPEESVDDGPVCSMSGGLKPSSPLAPFLLFITIGGVMLRREYKHS